MPRIDFSSDTEAFLNGLPEKQFHQISGKIERFAAAPKSVLVESISGYPGIRKMAAGEFRVILLVSADLIEVLLI